MMQARKDGEISRPREGSGGTRPVRRPSSSSSMKSGHQPPVASAVKKRYSEVDREGTGDGTESSEAGGSSRDGRNSDRSSAQASSRKGGSRGGKQTEPRGDTKKISLKREQLPEYEKVLKVCTCASTLRCLLDRLNGEWGSLRCFHYT
jgi:hypothetical protein